MLKPLALAALVFALALTRTPPTGVPGALQQPGSITVAAAISLTDVLEAIAAAYSGDGGGRVRFNFAGSNVLARQIANGAPADLFISADEAQMVVAAAAGAIAADTRVDLVSNRLAVVAPADRVEQIRSGFATASAAIRRLAIGDPAAVPAGRYAREYLQKRGLWAAFEPRVVPTANVRGALAAVQNGAADAAIVYATDLRASRGTAIVFIVEDADAPRIVYPAALTKAGRHNTAAAQFLQFLRGPKAAALFQQFGFLPAPGQRTGAGSTRWAQSGR